MSDVGLAELEGLVFVYFGQITLLLLPSLLVLVCFNLLREGQVDGSSPFFGRVFAFEPHLKESLLGQNCQSVLPAFFFDPTDAVAPLHGHDVDYVFELRIPGKKIKTESYT